MKEWSFRKTLCHDCKKQNYFPRLIEPLPVGHASFRKEKRGYLKGFESLDVLVSETRVVVVSGLQAGNRSRFKLGARGADVVLRIAIFTI